MQNKIADSKYSIEILEWNNIQNFVQKERDNIQNNQKLRIQQFNGNNI